MPFTSTQGRSPTVGLRTAMFQGLAPDGGLYMPAPLDPLPRETVATLRSAALAEIGYVVLRHLLDGNEVLDDELRVILRSALDFQIPLVPLDDRTFVLELFHGPTLAFKDVGARCMARLMTHFRRNEDAELTILVATSGDTGGAVADAFHGVPGMRVVVLYPRGRVSDLQARQFTTLGGNVTAVAVEGSFDDCQQLVKQALADGVLRTAITLTSANSINVGRLLPQAVYYFHARAQLPDQPQRLVCSTPSGNFGNLAAGLMAKRTGLEIDRFVAATNENCVVPEYLETGVFSPRSSVRTISTAMDVGNPSNLARILHLYGGNRDSLLEDLVGSWHTDDETRDTIRAAFEQYGYVLDPHSAVAYAALHRELERDPNAIGVLLATAHPVKFAGTIEPVIGQTIASPDRLAACLERKPMVTVLKPRLAELRRLLTD